MGVVRNLLYSQRLLFGSRHLADLIRSPTRAGPHVNRNTARPGWKGKCLLAVAAVGGTDQLEEHVIFRNRECLPLTKHPPVGSEITCEHSDFSDIWSHFRLLL